MLEVTFIFLGLSLDSFIAMMQKGASLKELPFKKLLLYTFLFTVIHMTALAAGYLVSLIFDGLLPDGKVQMSIAALLCFSVGNYILVRTFLQKEFVEKLDRNFNIRSLARLAAITSVTTFVTGIGFSLFGIGFLQALWRAFAVSFVAVAIGLNIGYSMGAGYQKVLGISGGILMIVFSAWLLVKFVLLR